MRSECDFDRKFVDYTPKNPPPPIFSKTYFLAQSSGHPSLDMYFSDELYTCAMCHHHSPTLKQAINHLKGHSDKVNILITKFITPDKPLKRHEF